MAATRPYRAQRRPSRTERTRARILEAVRELLAEGAFHESPVEAVAERAGVSRATLYQHFGSRMDLVDAICDTFAVNPALVEIREAVELPDAQEALERTVALSARFWASEDPVLGQLYGVVAVDPAARALVERQREDRRGEMRRLARHLRRAGRLRDGLSERDAIDALMLVTSYESFRELREAGRSERRATTLLQDSAHRLLLAT
jgi:AcrR family transcriptional regulator